MDKEEAIEIVLNEVCQESGVYTLLRLGQTPDPVLGRDLCIALRTLWRAFQDQPTQLPTDVMRACAGILAFYHEATINLNESSDSKAVTLLNDIGLNAYGVLMGRETQMVFRADLDDNAEYFRYKS